MLRQQREAVFNEKLFAMYDEDEKYLVNKTNCHTIVSDLKLASDDPHKIKIQLLLTLKI